MTAAELPIRAARAEEWPAIAELFQIAFHQDHDPDWTRLEGHVFEAPRALVAHDDERLVGHTVALSRELTVPGAIVPAAHVTLVGVHPLYRRRRLATRLLHHQLRQVRSAGREPVAVLWASESTIYPRFGYGLASQRLALTIDSRAARPTPADPSGNGPAGAVLPAGGAPSGVEQGGGWLVDGAPAAVRDELAAVFDAARARQPGWSGRDARWWDRRLDDPPAHRYGATGLRAALHRTAHGTDGYALWRTRSGWRDRLPAAEVLVQEVCATTPAAYRALWELLLDLDLTRLVRYEFAALDEPLQHLVGEARALGAQVVDGLWLRIVDLPAALGARRYLAPVDVVLEITDPVLPENAGRWRLTGGPSSARCEPTTDPADLACTVTDLGAAYLGGVSLATLAGAGRVRELRPGGLAPASVAFGWHRQPSAVEIF